MKVAMPKGNTHGWGIAGSYLADEIAKLPPIDGVTLHSVAGHHFAPTFADEWNRINIGYCFFESEIIAYRFIREASKRWDYIVAGSSWCEYHLRIAGMDRTSTILQGIDPSIFMPSPPRVEDGRFVVFSGGKFEFRKGHDLVIAAMRTFMNNHPDAFLACAWHNHWPASIKTMEQSRLIDFSLSDLPCEEIYLKLMRDNGIPLERVILYPVMDNFCMRQAYLESDIGLFPNRCEGGNNMVMCEYMACGRPVIASDMTGHMDVINGRNALCLGSYEPVLAVNEGEPAGVWFEPSLDEVVAQLERAYGDRQALINLASAAGESMKALSWSEAARKFHALGMQLVTSIGGGNGTGAVLAGSHQESAAKFFMAGRYEEAAGEYSRLLQQSPLDPDLHNNLGTTLDRLERYAESALHYEKAIALRPDFSEARFNLANTMKRIGDKENAIRHLEKVVADSPTFVEAWQNLALCRLDDDNRIGAVEALGQVLAIAPDCSKSLVDMGDILCELGRYEEALDCFDKVLLTDPDNAGVLNSKGNVLQNLDNIDGAEECYRRILARDPDNVLALNNLGTVYRSRALPELAIACFNRALEIEPDDGQLIFNRSLARLSIADFKNGWADYESRFRSKEPVHLAHAELPRWSGERLDGKRLLVQSEQGYGDTLQFVRYLPLLHAYGGHVVFECQNPLLKGLLSGIKGVECIIARGEPLPKVDCQIPLLSIPGLLATELVSIPSPEGYLRADLVKKAYWHSRLDSGDNRLKIGLTWGGRKTNLNANRSMKLSDLEPLFSLKGVRFFSLQMGEDAAQLSGHGAFVEDLSPYINDFSDTAAIVENLDLVITIDTALAHLCGALGCPVWVVLKVSPDWRWYLNRDDSPWYASARLFRQKKYLSWAEVISSVRDALEKFENSVKRY